MEESRRSSFLFLVAIILSFRVYQNLTSCIEITNESTTAKQPEASRVSTIDEKLNNPVGGFFPGWDAGEPVDRATLNDTLREFLPKRLITVVGLESSGTTFLQHVLSKAVGASISYEVEFHTADLETRVQHLSLPTGYFPKQSPNRDRQYEKLPIVPVHVPYECRLNPSLNGAKKPSPKKCHVLFGKNKVDGMERYFVNITSHVDFYQRRGVDVTLVLVVRDPAMHFRGITKTHCANETAAFEQFQTGRLLLRQAMELLDPSSLVIVSYEMLMTLRQVYLKEIYESLRITSEYKPAFKNGNLAYAPDRLVPTLVQERLATDTGAVEYIDIPKNMYEPKSYKELRGE